MKTLKNILAAFLCGVIGFFLCLFLLFSDSYSLNVFSFRLHIAPAEGSICLLVGTTVFIVALMNRWKKWFVS